MDTLLLVLVPLTLILILVLVRRKLEKPPNYNASNELVWGKLENDLLLKCDVQRVIHNKPMLNKDDGNKILADSRCYQAYLFYKENGFLDTTFHHTLFNGTLFKNLRKKGLQVVRENIARGYQPENVMQKWIDSEDHLKNLTGNYKYTGISAQQFEGVWYYCQIFSR